MRINYKLFRGTIDRNLTVSYSYQFETTGDFQTIMRRENGNITILPSFGISISKGFDQERIYVTSNQYYAFTSLLEQIVKLVSEHLYEIFPGVGRAEFDVDAKTLERFQTEKAVSTDGITMIPAVFVDGTNQCFPGIQINTLKFGSIRIPLQDAIPMSKLFKGFDPNIMSISLLQICSKI